MSGRNHAFLDLAALPAVGPVLFSDAPALLYAADGRRVLFANAAGAAFAGETSIAALLERRLSVALPATDAIARFARSVPIGAARLERIRFSSGGRLVNLAAHCSHVALPGGDTAVLVQLAAPAGLSPVAERARRLVDALAAEDCLVALVDAEGQPLAIAGEFEQMAAGEAAIEQLAGVLRKSGERLVKRVLRVSETRRPAGMVRFESGGIPYHLMVLGPGERIEIEPVAPVASEAPAPEPTPAVAALPLPETVDQGAVDANAASAADDVAEAPVAPIAEAEPASPLLPVEAGSVPSAPPEPEGAPEPPEAVDAPLADAAPEAGPTLPLETAELATADEPAFRFVQPGGPIRFVFQMDAETRFTFVSPDLAAVVGRRSSEIVGAKWGEVAAARGLDSAALASVLARRDTWSGVTLEWPVDGSDERVAVDLAALPAFSRERRFEGYRGFGVIRPLERRDAGNGNGKPALAIAAAPAAGEPPASNVVRLPRVATPTGEAERLSPPEQDAFRRIAAALGVEEATRRSEQPAPVAGDQAPEPEAEPVQPAPATSAPEPERVLSETAAEEISAPEASQPDIATPEPARPESAAEASHEVSRVPDAIPDGLDLLDEAEQRILELEAMLDTATDGILVIDEEGLIERINRSAEALFGIDASSVAGRPFTELLAEESRKSALDYLDGLARNGVASVLNDGREVIGRVPQGGLIPLFMTMGRLPATARFCAVLRDITQWKNAEEELINAKRAAESASMQKSDFLAKVSHEIRTPLNAIIGFSEVMMEERFGPIGTERYKEYLRDIHVSGAHLMSLLNDLLDLSKIEAGKLDLSFQAVALNEIVMECVAVMQPQANRERIIIRTSLSSEVPNIVADARSIRQIVLNLVSNAIKFTLAGGQVIVSTVMEPHGEVTLRIRDTGVGMSASDIETALKPFRQLSTSRARRSDGTGLGLPLTKALVEANRAAFAIDSTVGQGTLVRVTFPATRVLAG